MTKLEIAIELVKSNADKKQALDAIVEELSVTRANAFVYWSKAVKALGIEPVKVERVARAVKASRKTNPITGTSPEKAEAKIAEIDAMISELKANGVPNWPFPGVATEVVAQAA